MNIIVGATGQVGSILINEIRQYGLPMRAVVRNPERLKDKSIEHRIADLFNIKQLTEAFKGGTTVFVITPENPTSSDIIGETAQIVENYKKAIRETGIKRIIALSCVGAHINGGTGNILMSRILEQGIDEIEAEKIFVRPSYYFSNWLGYLETIEDYGALPTFFPENLKIEMHSPIDLAEFIAKIVAKKPSYESKQVYELTGQQKYSSMEIASNFSKLLNKDVVTQPIPPEKWREMLLSAGFTENTAANLMDMTQAVIDNKAVPEKPISAIKLPTLFDKYLEQQLQNYGTIKY
tara:strand:+ start:25907 stop:26785 length:879 start_codon:yes stop_codon:yes gene_type:complete